MDNTTDKSTEELDMMAQVDPAAWMQLYHETMDLNLTWPDSKLEPMGSYIPFTVQAKGGGEGGGEYVERVFAIATPNNEVKADRVIGAVGYARITGFYESYEDTEWDDDWKQVFPRDVMVVQYFETAV